MYLSRLILDPRNRNVRRDLADCYGMHRTLMKAFPQMPADDRGARSACGLLFRVEYDRQTGMPVIYAHSRLEPDWAYLPGRYLVSDRSGCRNPACKDVRDAYSAIREGQKLVFTLTANPTRKTGTLLKSERLAGAAKSNGRRIYIADPEEQLEWLRRKGEQHGFAIMSVDADSGILDTMVTREVTMRGWKNVNNGEERVTLTLRGCTFRGRLQVTNKSRFMDAIANGIGSGKAYGFGMLSVAPIRAFSG